MKKGILNATLIVAIGFGIYSCNKEKIVKCSDSERNTSELIVIDSKENLDKSNVIDFVNPFEFSGLIHNKVLEALFNFPNIENINIYDQYVLIDNIVKQELSILGFTFELSHELTMEEIDNLPTTSTDEDWQNLLNSFDKKSQNFISKFDDEVNHYLKNQNYELAIEKMKKIEFQLFNDQNVSKENKTLILNLLSIGRYSFVFWRNETLKNGNTDIIIERKIKDDIKGFNDAWNDPVADNGSLGDRIRYAIAGGAYASRNS